MAFQSAHSFEPLLPVWRRNQHLGTSQCTVQMGHPVRPKKRSKIAIRRIGKVVPLRKSISTQTPGRKKMLKSWFLRPSEIWFVGIPKSCATLAMSQSFILSWHQSHLNSALSLHASWFRGVDFFGEIHRKLHSFTPNVGVSGVSHSTYPYHIPLTMFFWEAWYGLAMVQLGAGGGDWLTLALQTHSTGPGF